MDLFSFSNKSKKIHLAIVLAVLTSNTFFFTNCSENYKTIDLNEYKLSSTDLGSVNNPNGTQPPAVTKTGDRLTYVCKPNEVAKTPAVKLSKREFRLALLDLIRSFNFDIKSLGNAEVEAAINLIPSDDFNKGHFTVKEDNFVQSARAVNGYFDSAFVAGGHIANSYNLGEYDNIIPGSGACLRKASVINQTCHQNLVKQLANVAFRKNLDTAAVNALAATLWDATLTREQLIQLTFTSIAQMPDFIYRVYDQGVVSPRGERVLTLNAFDLASKVSFFLVGKGPDATLRNLATSGQILDKTVLSQQIDRLLATNDAKENMKRLFRESYGYDRFDAFNYTNEFLNNLNRDNLPNAMKQELDDFFVNIAITKKGKFSDLLTSQESTVPSDQLAAVYELPSKGNVVLQNHRAGFINRAAFLARKSGNYTSPVKRGLAIVENVLCETIPDPPPSAPTTVSEEQIISELQSTRDRYTHLTEIKGSSCLACHSQMNPIGYTFENFDSIGRYRTAEKIFSKTTGAVIGTARIIPQAVIPNLDLEPTNITDSTHLARNLSDNDKAIMCFTRHLKAFQGRAPATTADGCHLNESLQVLYGTNGNQGTIEGAIKSFILSENFKLWSY